MITYNAELKVTIKAQENRIPETLQFDDIREILNDLPEDIQSCLNCEFDEFEFTVELVSDELTEN